MQKIKATGNNQQTPQKILDTAEKFFAKNGYFGTSMSDIANVIKISKPAIYHHFKSKKDLYFQLIKNISIDLEAKLEKVFNKKISTIDKLNKFITTYIKFGLKRENVIKLIFQGELKLDKEILNFLICFHKRLINRIAKLLQKINTNPKTHLIKAQLLLGMLNGFIISQTFDKKSKKIAIEKITNEIKNLFIK